MSRNISHARVVVPPNSSERRIDYSYLPRVEGTARIVRLVESSEPRYSYDTRRLQDLRCPICGRFACGGC